MYRKSALILFIIILCAFAATVQGTVQQSAPASLQSPGAMLASGAWGSLWNVSSMRSIMPDTKLAASKANAVRLSAARNEFEPFQLVLRPLKQLKNVKVVPHVLSGPAGANIGAWNINVRNVGYVKTAASTSNPDPLPDFKPFTAVAGANSAMWVTVYVPDKTTPGDYRGTVDIMADGLAKITVPVVVHVWNFTLPSVSSLRTAFACDFNEAARQHNASTLEEKRKLVELYDLDFWRHRVAPMVPYAFHNIKASLDGDRLSLDFSDFDVAVKKFLPLFNSFNLPSFGPGETPGVSFGNDYERLKTEYMRSVTEHLADKGQITKAYNYIDIANDATPEQLKAVKDIADLCQRADGRIKVLLPIPYDKQLSGYVDIWAPAAGQYLANTTQAGQVTWWSMVSDPGAISLPGYRSIPWLVWESGVRGIVCKSQMFYSPATVSGGKFVAAGPVPSIRLEMIREGMEDYEYLRILKDKLDKAKSAKSASPAVAKAKEALVIANRCARDRVHLEECRAKLAAAIETLK